MTHNFLKKAGVKSEREFYSKYPTEDHYFAEHPEDRPSGQQMAYGGKPGYYWDGDAFKKSKGSTNYGMSFFEAGGKAKKKPTLQEGFFPTQTPGEPFNRRASDSTDFSQLIANDPAKAQWLYQQYKGIPESSPAYGNAQEALGAFDAARNAYRSGKINPSTPMYPGGFDSSLPTPHVGFKEYGGIDRYSGGGTTQYGGMPQMQAGGPYFNPNGPLFKEDGGEYLGYDPEEASQMKVGGIHIKPENRGKFTAYKKRTGKTTEEALHSPDPHVRKMANFARNAKHFNHSHMYGGQTMEEGGYVKGSTHELEDHEIQALISKGYKVKYL